MKLNALPATALRVERSTAPDINEHIRALADAELLRLEDADERALASSLAALDQEWDIERTLQLNASILVLVGLSLGTWVNKRFFFLPAMVFSFFAQHALHGWCPPIPIFRRLGIRTQREIERERYAIKGLRGDFDELLALDAKPSQRVRGILKAIDA